MDAYRIENLVFVYPGESEPALKGVSLDFAQGQFITLCGPSGGGKTTLLRQLKSALAPHGARSGTILFEGTPLEDMNQRAQCEKIGFVLQSPENQIVTDKVWHELAFGLESLGYDTPTIRLRVAEMASFFGIQTWFHQSVTELSGGQKQLLNLAAVMAMQPNVLILDEPTSQLDPIAAADFLATVSKINRELGVTVLLTEHRLEDALPLSDRCIVLEGGQVIADGSPKQVGETLKAQNHAMFLAMPTPMRVWAAVENQLSCPITVREGREWLTDYAADHTPAAIPSPPTPVASGGPMIELDHVWFRYEKDAPDVVKGLSLSVNEGQFCALVGGNGTGKTTTLSLISGINRPYRGTVRLGGRRIEERSNDEKFGGLLGVLPQNPQALFVKKTVQLDLQEMLADREMRGEERAAAVEAVAVLCELKGLLTRHPYDLSGGERQRAALAKVLLLEPRVLLLDEPTKGMDGYFKEKFARILKELLRRGTTILMVSHDVEFCARYADYCAMCFDGAIVTQGPTRAFFSGNSFYTTAANRMARHLLPEAVVAEDIIVACGGKRPQPPAEPPMADTAGQKPSAPKDTPKSPAAERVQTPIGQRKLTKRTVLAAVLFLMLVPLTLYFGVFYLDSKQYYFTALLIMFETMIPFFMVFEGRKPQARELVVLAVLCAIGVAGRAAFFMLPQFKPVTALVILAAVAFGGETGFLVGAVTMLVSNFFYTQGPWTPWQMCAMGIIGFLAGVLFHKGVLRRDRMALSIYGFLAVMIIYGGIMNPSAILIGQGSVTWQAVVAAWVVGIPMDLIHATATALFLWFGAPAMLEKLDRVKEKYGLMGAQPH